MSKLKDLRDEGSSCHICIYGDPGSGKSTLASQLAEAGYKLYWLSLDNGHRVLFKLSEKAQDNVELIRLPDTRDFPVSAHTAREISKGKACHICDTHGQINCSACKKKEGAAWTDICCREFDAKTVLVVDNATMLSETCMFFATEGKPDSYRSDYDDWRLQGFIMNDILTNLQQASWHSIVICQAADLKMEDGNKKLAPVIGSDNFSRRSSGYFDNVIFCHIQNNKHAFGSASTYKNGVITKSRDDVVIEKMEKPALLPFFQAAAAKKSAKQEVREATEGVKKSVRELAALVEDSSICSSIIDDSVDTSASLSGSSGVGELVTGKELEEVSRESEEEKQPEILAVSERAKAALERLRNRGKG